MLQRFWEVWIRLCLAMWIIDEDELPQEMAWWRDEP